MTNELMTIGNIAEIKDVTVRRATKAMNDAIKAGQKSGWQFAVNASIVKEAFSPAKGIEVSSKLKEQFGTIKGYCEATGISTAAIHNSAKALAFMSREHLVPSIIGKDGKTRIDYDRFTLNVAQAVELGAMTPEEFKTFKATCEQSGIDVTKLSSATIRKMKNEQKKLTEGRHVIADEKEATKEVKEAKEAKNDGSIITVTEDQIAPYNPTKEEVVAIIKNMMSKYNVTIDDLQV